MTSSKTDISPAFATAVRFGVDTFVVDLADGRSLTVPMAWYPRLLHGTLAERENWQLIGRGQGIHWPSLDEDLSIESLLAGRRSGEGQQSLKRWLEDRARP